MCSATLSACAGQLKALELTRHHAQALAAAGLGDAGTVDALTAITVQQIQHRVLSILLRAAELESSGQTRTAADTIGAGAADPGKEPGGCPRRFQQAAK